LPMSILGLTISYRIIELLLKYGKSSFLRKQESSLFKAFWIPAGVYPVLDTGRE